MRRALKWTGIVVLIVLTLPVLVAGGVLLAANTDPGRRFIERETASVTGGMVQLAGLAGRFPDALRIGEISISDAKGTYVTVSDVVLDWSPLKLLEHTARINNLRVGRVALSRLPESADQKASDRGGGAFNLPVRVVLSRLHVDQIVLGASIVGTAATLSADGSALVKTITEGSADLDVHRRDSPGHYVVDGNLTPGAIRADVSVDEPAKGLLSSLAHLPGSGAITVRATVDGPMDHLGTRFNVTAGDLTASADGTVDLDHRSADLAVKARAPAMAPAPGVSWRSVLVDATVHGPFEKPEAKGNVRIDALEAAGAKIGALVADLSGDAGQVGLHATISDLHIPGPKPDLFAASPVEMDVSARLDRPDRPVTFAVHHPLVTADGTALTGGDQQVKAHVILPDLLPVASAGGMDIAGSADLMMRATISGDTTQASANGRVSITGGMAPVPAWIGDEGQIDLAATVRGRDMTLSHLTVHGTRIDLTGNGGLSGQTIDAKWEVALPDLAAVQPSVAGTLHTTGQASGTLDNIAARMTVDTDLTAKGYSSGKIIAHIDATGLPGAPRAKIDASGTLLDAPLNIALTAAEQNGAVQADIQQLAWKSLQGHGTLGLTPPAVIPAGNLQIDFARLADLEPLLGHPIGGKAKAALDSTDRGANLTLELRDVAIPGTASVSRIALNGTVSDPAGRPVIDATMTADGVSAGRAKAVAAKVTAKGPMEALVMSVTANAPDLAGGPVKLATSGTLDANGKTLALASLETSWKQQVLRLLAPAKFAFADGVSIDRMRLGFRQAELSVSGSAGSKLDLTATLRDLPADIGMIVNPGLAADGTIGADLHLTGTAARPEGRIRITATGIRQRTGPGQALPAANLVADATLQGTVARVETKLTAGPSHVAITGTAPVSKDGSMDLKTDGRLDLAMLDPILSAQGERARGEVTLAASVTGAVGAPQIRGTAELRNGDIADFAIGARVAELGAVIEATGDTIRLTHFSGKAGPGTLGGSGSVGLAGDMPVDLHFTAANARPLSSDLMTALIDADLSVRGQAKGDLDAGGTLKIRHADIRIPDKLPPSVAVLPVRNAGTTPPPQAAETARPTNIALNLTVSAPQQVFIRGRGLDAELGGTIHVTGTAARPQPDGGFKLRHGTMSLVGSTLNFTEGTVDFSGAGISDPTIRFVATSTTASLVATLTISGSAKDPRITLSSVPDMPQDEILAQLLFNTSTSKLSPLQLAEIASALATLSGATGSFDPLATVRSHLGLDRLSVGSDTSGNPQIQAGRYVARGVYVGAKQSTSGGGTQGVVQIDLAKGLKLESTAGSGSTASAVGSTSTGDAASVGLTYQFEY